MECETCPRYMDDCDGKENKKICPEDAIDEAEYWLNKYEFNRRGV
jgi:hypothetical protein